MTYNKIIIGAGLYGLYSALYCAKNGDKILVLEYDAAPFKRATYINQARVHMGYHYPRSFSTAIKSAHYFDRFNQDYGYCINSSFDKIYATSKDFSWSNASQFKQFCANTDIICDEVSPEKYFNEDMCDGAFLTKEYTYDAEILKNHLLQEIEKYQNIHLYYNTRILEVQQLDDSYCLHLNEDEIVKSSFILNATYASVNQIIHLFGFETLPIKYELCEIILCEVSDKLKNIGITVMDGPFFSIMPFGNTGLHSLTAVTFTPHLTSYDRLPTFSCQKHSNGFCSPEQLGNCNDCVSKPKTAWDYMSNLAKKYLRDEHGFSYVKSLYSMKPILIMAEIDDSRPTIIRKFSDKPTFISVLSGKINTVYDLDEVLKNGN